MEITIKVSKKEIFSYIVIPLLVVGVAIYFFLNWGKPLDVSSEIWLKGKKFYENRIVNNNFSMSERKKLTIETGEFLVSNHYEGQGYSKNERNILKGLHHAFFDVGTCDDPYDLDSKKIRCEDYKNGIQILTQYYE